MPMALSGRGARSRSGYEEQLHGGSDPAIPRRMTR